MNAAMPSAGQMYRRRAPISSTASTANATPTTIAPPPSEPSAFSAIVASASPPTAMNASQPNALCQQRSAEERGEEEPRLEQVGDAEEAARQLGPDRRERERRRSKQHRDCVGREQHDERDAELGLPSRKNIGPRSPPATVQRPSSVTRGIVSPAGNQPITRFTAIAAPSAVGAPRG